MLDVSADGAAPVELDQTQQGTLVAHGCAAATSVAAETQRRRHRQVQMLDAALQRLDDGEYGYCVNCGEEIEADRLTLDPATPFCIAAQSNMHK